MKKAKTVGRWQQDAAVRVTKVHFVYVAAYVLATIVFDSWNLYTHEAVAELWTAAAVLLGVVTILWYCARRKFTNPAVYSGLVTAVVLAGVAFAGYNVFWQQGLASKSVALFAVPIVTAAALRSRSAIMAAATLSAVTYSTVSVRYFFDNYGEGYRVELWGTIGFFSALFFILALLLNIVIQKNNN